MMLLQKFLKLSKSKGLFHRSLTLIDIFKILSKRLFKSQLLLNKLNKSLEKMKRQLRLETNIKQSKKLNQLSRKLLQSKNSKRLLEILIILKRFCKLLIDLNKPQLKYQFKKKNLLKFLTFLKRQLKRLLLCHKQQKS